MARDGITFVDLFAGCGGLALGFKREGFRAVGAVEIDPDAAETYALNIDDDIYVDDIASVTKWPRAQVVIGGPPCQGFSQLGRAIQAILAINFGVNMSGCLRRQGQKSSLWRMCLSS